MFRQVVAIRWRKGVSAEAKQGYRDALEALRAIPQLLTLTWGDDARHFEGNFEQLCARCLEPVRQPLSGTFDLIFRPGGVDAEPGERAITEDETEIGYYEQSGLLLEDAVREQVLLTLPGRTLCREDCKGLCPHCGINRNLATCECVEKPVDPRLSVLAGIAVGHKA